MTEREPIHGVSVEHKIVEINFRVNSLKEIEEQLDRVGLAGWQMVQLDDSAGLAYFTRTVRFR